MNASIILLLAVALLLCFMFAWDNDTHRMIDQVIVETYTQPHDVPSPEPFIYRKYRLHDYEGCTLEDIEDVDFDEPDRRIKKTRRWYYRFAPSHSGKGATLHTYRVKGFSKDVLHPVK